MARRRQHLRRESLHPPYLPKPPPFRVLEGWLHVYHGIATHGAGCDIYQAGVLLLDAQDPTWIIVMYPNSIPPHRYDLLERRGYTERERLDGWIDWTNGDVVIWCKDTWMAWAAWWRGETSIAILSSTLRRRQTCCGFSSKRDRWR